MKIVFDNIIFSLQKSGGISVYWSELLSRIVNQTEIFYSFIDEEGNEDNIFRSKLKIDSNNRIIPSYMLTSYLNRYRNLDFNTDNNNFIFHSSYYRSLNKTFKKKHRAKEVVTVHDFTYEHFSTGLRKWINCWQKKNAVKSADVIICISENTKKDLLHFYPQFSKKDIRVVYNGVSEEYYIIPKLSIKNYEIPYFLYVGSRTKYKNFDFVVKAVSLVDNYVLKIVGGSLSKNELKLLESKLSGRWQFLENIDNIKLNILYNRAFALFYPSSYEGFGIPIAEAMKAGCPFISLKGSSITEIAGEAGFLMDELNFNEFFKGIVKIKNNRNKIIELGLSRANSFSWDKCYNEVVEIYKELNN
jgi:mannosyltransferase